MLFLGFYKGGIQYFNIEYTDINGSDLIIFNP